MYIDVTVTFSAFRKTVSQHPKLTNKSVLHEVYICLKGTELSFPWCIYMACGTSDCHPFKSRSSRHLLTVGSFLKDFLYALIFLYFFFL